MPPLESSPLPSPTSSLISLSSTATSLTPSPFTRRGVLVACAAALGAGVSGCVVAPLGTHYPHQPVEGPTVDVAPPPPQYEVVPVAPAIGYVWIGGHWGWHMGRHTWIGGRWALPPRGYASC